MKRVAVVLVVVAACGGDAPLEPEIPDISGDWTFTESWSNDTVGITCENTGSMVVEQSGGTFAGSYSQQGTCTNRSGGTFDDSASGTIRVGQISGQLAGFTAANCNYRGSISGSPPNRLSGTVHCILSQGGVNVIFIGLWTATK